MKELSQSERQSAAQGEVGASSYLIRFLKMPTDRPAEMIPNRTEKQVRRQQIS
jgi:hypothetical protein